MAENRVVIENCRDCGVTLNRWQKSRHCRYCGACGLRYCQTCWVRLPPNRNCRRCKECNRAEKARRAADPNHCCSACRAPLPGKTRTYCTDCTRADHDRALRRKQEQGPRPCQNCGELMPAGRWYNDCRVCRRQKRQSTPSRLCARCGARQSVRGESFCQPCQNLYATWRRAYHAGDPVARRMKPLKQYRKWQQPLEGQ